jgi:hypothetical protein
MKLYIWTQCRENYGTAEQPYWKFKGGIDYFVPMGKRVSDSDVTATVMAVRGDIECTHPMYEEYILGWEVVADDYMTDFEKSQLDFEGQIRYPTKVLETV